MIKAIVLITIIFIGLIFSGCTENSDQTFNDTTNNQTEAANDTDNSSNKLKNITNSTNNNFSLIFNLMEPPEEVVGG